jgi:outer membrane protein assembly factor BamE (lipoprotein component of BamABCDE complex)
MRTECRKTPVERKTALCGASQDIRDRHEEVEICATVEKGDRVSLRRVVLAARARSSGSRLMLAATLLCISACSLGLARPKVIDGAWFPEGELTRIQRGASSADVRRIGGTPLETTTTAEGERWRYFMTVERREHVKVVGVIPQPSRRSLRTFEVVFVVRHGVVTDATSRDTGAAR